MAPQEHDDSYCRDPEDPHISGQVRDDQLLARPAGRQEPDRRVANNPDDRRRDQRTRPRTQQQLERREQEQGGSATPKDIDAGYREGLPVQRRAGQGSKKSRRNSYGNST